MKRNAWLAASIAMGLTVGFGARILTGADATGATPDRDAPALERAAGATWTHPAITVVVKVPSKTAETALEEAAEATWTHPAVTVVMKVPAKAEAFRLAGSTAEATRPAPARLWYAANGNPGGPGDRLRVPRRRNDGDVGPRVRGRDGAADGPGAGRVRGSAGPRRPAASNRADSAV